MSAQLECSKLVVILPCDWLLISVTFLTEIISLGLYLGSVYDSWCMQILAATLEIRSYGSQQESYHVVHKASNIGSQLVITL